jgi:hypothetical protein
VTDSMIGLLISVGIVVFVVGLFVRITGSSLPILDGAQSMATIDAWKDTGMYEKGTGDFGSIYDLVLSVTPIGGVGERYKVRIRSTLERVTDPDVGDRVPMIISRRNPMRVKIDHERTRPRIDKGWHTTPATGTEAGYPDPEIAVPVGGFNVAFDADGRPSADDVADLASGVHHGTVKQIHGSASEVLATGVHGTAVITGAQPLGKTVRDVNPKADPSRIDDPMWLFTVEAKLPGEAPFPAVFGHRVPIAKVPSVVPGVKLVVAVDMDDHNRVAIDWDRSPLAGQD